MTDATDEKVTDGATTPADRNTTKAISPRGMVDPVPFQPRNVDEMFRLARGLAAADLLPWKYQQKPQNLMLVLLKGHELGLSTMQAIGNVNVIDGKAELGAAMMKALVLKSGKCRLWKVHEHTEERCIVKVERSDWPVGEFELVEYTKDEAAKLGLLTKGKDETKKAANPWVTQLKNMLLRRAESRAARQVWPDVVIAYDHGEIRDSSESYDEPRATPSVGPINVGEAMRTAPAFEDAVFVDMPAQSVSPAPPGDQPSGAGETERPTSAPNASTPPEPPEPLPVTFTTPDKLYTGAFANFAATVAKSYGVTLDMSPPLSPEQVIEIYEGIVSEVNDAKALRASFGALVNPFRTTAPKSELSKTAAAGMQALYSERNRSMSKAATS